MEFINFLNEEVPINDDYQAIVIGGGTSGSVAAIAATRMGVKTLIIEKGGALGGSTTLAQVTPMMPLKIEGNPDISAINKEIKTMLHQEGYGAKDPNGNDGWFNPEMLKFILEDIYLSYGGELLYNTEFIKPVMMGDRIKFIIVHNKSGLKAYRAQYFIDCTGDADLAFLAGVPCKRGFNKNKYQAISLRFMVANIDLSEFARFLSEQGQDWGLDYPLIETAMVWGKDFALEKVFKKALENEDLKREDGKYFQAFSIPGMPGAMSFNCPEIPGHLDSLDPVDLTKARIKGRQMMKRLLSFLKKYCPGFVESYIASQAEMLGVRESRRIIGQYVLDQEDYRLRRKFKDAIARSAYPIDIHGDNLEITPLKNGEYYEVPFRTMVPNNIKNLLVAGRSISTTFNAQSAIRIQAVCRATGEAAGIAVADLIAKRVVNNQLDGSEIRKKMISWGAEL